MANDTQTFDFGTQTSTSTDTSTTLLGELWHESKVWTKAFGLATATGVAKGTKKSREYRNHGGNPLDDGMFSSLLRTADETDFARILDKEVIQSRVDALDSWLDNKGYALFGQVTVHSLTPEEKTLIEETVAELRADPVFAGVSDFKLFETAMKENEKSLLESRKAIAKAQIEATRLVREALAARDLAARTSAS